MKTLVLLLLLFVSTNTAQAEVVEVIGFNGEVIKLVDCNEETGRCITIN